MKTIIAGSRDFDSFALVDETCEFLGITEVVSGGARGADKVGELFAEYYRLPLKRFPANWEKYGRSAGHRRNAEMAKYADAAVVFWDGKSPGSKGMIDQMKRLNKPCKVVRTDV